jgi:Ca-activated chloride channel family protein
MDVHTDYYMALGLRPSATLPDIKRAYRILARRFHPDTTSASDARQRFHRIQEAYEILSDPEQKRAYDQWREKEGLGAEQALVLKHLLSHRVLPLMNEEQVLYLLLQISASPHLKIERLPFNVCLVLDKSTSMQGVRLQRVKDATNFIVNFLDEPDIFSLVTFSDRAEVVIPAQSNLDKAFARSRISTIRSSGGTEILQGMLAGLREIDRWRSPNMVNHLILLTDGQTYGGEKECLEEAQAAGLRQISITTMGIGQDWNDKLLDDIARRSGGTSTYIDSAAKVTSFFRDCVRDLTMIVARDLNLTVRLPEGVRIHEVFRVSPHLEKLHVHHGAISLGQLGAEQPGSLIIEFLIHPRVAGPTRIAQLQLTADVPSADRQSQLIKRDIEIQIAENLDTIAAVPPIITSTLGKLAIFRMQERTMSDLEQGELEQASQRLETMATRLLNIGENELAKSALLEAGRLARTGQISPEGRKKIRYGTRGLSILPKEVSYG